MAWAAVKANTADNGLADTTDLTTANSGSGSAGDAFTRLIIPGDVGSGNSLKVSTASALGARVWRLVQATTVGPLIYYAWTTAQGDWGITFKFRYTASPGTTFVLARGFSETTAGTPYTTAKLGISLTSSNKIYVSDTPAGVNSANSTGTLASNTNYVLTARYQNTTGDFTATVYPVGSGTAQATASVTVATSTSIGSARLGVGTAGAGVTIDMRDLVIGGGGAVPRTDITASAPVTTRTGGAVRIVPVGTTFAGLTSFGGLLAATATDADSNITGFTGTVTARPAGSTLPVGTGSPTGIGTAAVGLTLGGTAQFDAVGEYTVTFTATDGALSGSDTFKVQTYPANNVATKLIGGTLGNFVIFGSESDPLVALSDSDPNTGVESPTGATGEVLWTQYAAVGPNGITSRISALRNGSGTATCHAELYKADKVTKVGDTATGSGLADLVFGPTDAAQTIVWPAATLSALPADQRYGLWLKEVWTLT